MGIWDRVNSIANRLLPDNDDDQRGNTRGQPGQYNDYGPADEYDPRYDQNNDLPVYSDEPVDDQEIFDYETNSGDRYVRAGARMRPQQNQRGRSSNPFSGLIGKVFGGGNRQQQQPMQPLRDQRDYNRRPPDNVIAITDYDAQDERGRYEDQQRQSNRGRYDQQQGRAPQRGEYDERDYGGRGGYEEQQPSYDDRGGYDDYEGRDSYYEEEAPRAQRAPRGVSPTMLYVVRRLEDASEIIGHMINGGNVIVNMEDIDEVLKQRLLDMISGASFALDCSVKRISYRNYFIAPSGEEIVSNMGVRDRERETEDGGIRGGFRGRESRVKEYDRSRERSQGRDRDRDLDRDRDRDWDRGRY